MSKYAVMPMTDYEGICNAVRAKTGGTAKLKSSEVKPAIEGIQTGSDPVVQPLTVTENGTYTAPSGVDGYNPVTVSVESGGDTNEVNMMLDGSVTEINSDISSIRAYACYGMQLLKKAVFTNLQGFAGTYTFANCIVCETYDFHKHIQSTTGNVEYGIRSRTFSFNPNLTAVILRGENVIKLENTDAFKSCYRINGTVNSSYNPDGIKDGYFYVPAALVDSYKAATNWSSYADNFRALEDYTVDGTITGELDPYKI